MELVDTYDPYHRPTGTTISRNEKPEDGEFLLVVHACIFSSDDKMLIQQRHPNKDRYPGCWDVSAGGFARSGESSQTAVLRELNEELGLKLPAETVRYAFTEPFSWVLDDFYIVKEDIPVSSLQLQSEELTAARYASITEIFSMIRSGEFVDYDPSIFLRLQMKLF